MLSRTRLPSSGFIEPCLPSPADTLCAPSLTLRLTLGGDRGRRDRLSVDDGLLSHHAVVVGSGPETGIAFADLTRRGDVRLARGDDALGRGKGLRFGQGVLQPGVLGAQRLDLGQGGLVVWRLGGQALRATLGLLGLVGRFGR
jgi:hypothetical protein